MENIDYSILIPYVFITTFTPGPNNLSCASLSITFGIKKTMRYIWGVVTGFFLLLILCGFFSRFLLIAFPAIESLMRWIGALYILYLAYGTFMASFSLQKNTNPNVLGFYKGILLQFVNPKGIIYGLTLYTVFLLPLTNNYLHITLFSLTLAFIGLCSLLVWSFFGTIIHHYLTNPKLKIILNGILSLLLIYTALKISGIIS
ncbi:MAG: LysE family transporter [Candidatus Caldatribacteriota bacterium]